MQAKGWIGTALAIVAIAGLSYAAFEVLRPPALPAQVLYGNGHIEGTEVAVSAEVQGRVTASPMAEGEFVREGELLVRLDDAELKARLAQAEAELRALRQSALQVRRELQLWRHHVATAQEELSRIRRLRETGTATPRQLNAAEDRFREAQAQVDALDARAAEVEARIEAAGRALDLVQLQVDKTEIRAPISGAVLTEAIEVGELATPGRVVAVLVDLTDLDLKIYVPERELGKLQLGDPARVQVDAFPRRYFAATVRRVDQQAQFTPRDIHLPEERVRLVFGVILALKNPGGVLKPGMPADAWILWRDEAPWPESLVVPR